MDNFLQNAHYLVELELLGCWTISEVVVTGTEYWTIVVLVGGTVYWFVVVLVIGTVYWAVIIVVVGRVVYWADAVLVVGRAIYWATMVVVGREYWAVEIEVVIGVGKFPIDWYLVVVIRDWVYWVVV